MPKIDESDQDVGNEPPFVARRVAIKKGQNPKLDYTFSDELGRGRFGTVVKCTEKKTGLQLAAKFVSTRMREERENVEREVDIMKSLQHRRLLQLYDVYDGASEMCIITELINGGELFERVIDDDFELTEKVCAIFMRQIIEGVQYMHEKLIMHLDMKPENILCVTRTGNRIKLIDFGLARRFDPAHTLQVMFGTPDFAAPEVLAYERVTPAADLWSLGVICYVLLSGLSPFMGNSDLETMTNVTRATYDFDDESFEPISAEAKDFIARLLVKEPARRLKPAECLQHKWMAKTPARKGKAAQLDKTKLKKYVVRRRWQKAVTAIMALSRMGANLSLAGGAGATTAGAAASAKRHSALGASPRGSISHPAKGAPAGARTAAPRIVSQNAAAATTTTTTSSRLSSSRFTSSAASSSSSSAAQRAQPEAASRSSVTRFASSHTTTTQPTPAAGLSPSQANRTFATSSSQRLQTSSMSTTRRKY